MEKSRQVIRAETLREIKGVNHRSWKRQRRQASLALEERKAPVSSLRLAAQRAVSRIGRDHGKKIFA